MRTKLSDDYTDNLGSKTNFILANAPFNIGRGGGENLQQDVRWKFGMPTANNANYAWIQHFIHHLSPVDVAGFVLANTTKNAHSCSMKITGDVRKYAVEQNIADEEGLKKWDGRKVDGVLGKGRGGLKESMRTTSDFNRS
jgi:type I restriction enzyme M protein